MPINCFHGLLMRSDRKGSLIIEWRAKTHKNNFEYATSTFSTKHLICPPKFCLIFVFHFFWVLQPYQEKWKTMLMQKFRRQIRCIMGNVEEAYDDSVFNYFIKMKDYPTRSLRAGWNSRNTPYSLRKGFQVVYLFDCTKTREEPWTNWQGVEIQKNERDYIDKGKKFPLNGGSFQK